MPRYHFRLEAQDGSGHFRQGTVISPSEEEVRAFLERSEIGKTGYRLTTEEHDEIAAVLDELANVEQVVFRKTADLAGKLEQLLTAGVKVAGDVRMRITTHAQEHPYLIVYVSDSPPARDPDRKPVGGE